MRDERDEEPLVQGDEIPLLAPHLELPRAEDPVTRFDSHPGRVPTLGASLGSNAAPPPPPRRGFLSNLWGNLGVNWARR